MPDIAAVKAVLMRPADRDSVLGLRQLRYALQGVRAGRGAPDPVREARRRGEGPRVHRNRARGVAAHPLGPGGRLRRARRVREGPLPGARGDQLQHVPGRRLQARQRLSPGREDPCQGPGPSAGVRRHHGRDRLAGPEALVRGRHQLPRPGRHRRPPGPAGRGAGRGVRTPRRRPAAAAGVQVLRARLLHDGRARLGHRVRALPRAGTEGPGRRGHRAPRAGNQHRVHRRDAAARGKLGAFDFNSASTRTTT